MIDLRIISGTRVASGDRVVSGTRPTSGTRVITATIGTATVENTSGTLDLKNIVITNGIFSGYAFSSDLGWVDFGVVDNADGPVSIILTPGIYYGHVIGKAKVLNTGNFLDFDSNNSNVTVNMNNGAFSGYVWSEDVGWVDFTGLRM